jgi:CBS domain-containing protein
MKEHKIACLPVVESCRLVGVVSERDFFKISDQLLEDFLRGDLTPSPDRMKRTI